jgi:hypothetical protein
MNTGCLHHIPEDLLEKYTLDTLREADCAALEEHLLICSACRISLEEMDEYVNIMKAAIATLPRTPLRRSPQRSYRLAAPCGACP